MLIQASVITWRVEGVNSKARCTSSCRFWTSANSSASSGAAGSRLSLCQPPPLETTRPALALFFSRQNFSSFSFSRRRDFTARKLMKIGMMLIIRWPRRLMLETGHGKPCGAVHQVGREPESAANDLGRGNAAELRNGGTVRDDAVCRGGGVATDPHPAAMGIGEEGR